jgi:hypothetical protein
MTYGESDAKYVDPAHKTNSGKKDFWARDDGWVVDTNSTANFGVGAFLLAACEYVRYLEARFSSLHLAK